MRASLPIFPDFTESSILVSKQNNNSLAYSISIFFSAINLYIESKEEEPSPRK